MLKCPVYKNMTDCALQCQWILWIPAKGLGDPRPKRILVHSKAVRKPLVAITYRPYQKYREWRRQSVTQRGRRSRPCPLYKSGRHWNETETKQFKTVL